MKYKIALVPGDGIGPEIIADAREVLEKTAEKFGHDFEFNEYDAGGSAIDKHGVPLPQETIDGCLASDSVLLGAVTSRNLSLAELCVNRVAHFASEGRK